MDAKYVNTIDCHIASCFSIFTVLYAVNLDSAEHGLLGGGSTSLSIWLDDVQCTTGDQYMSECNHNGWGNTNCGYYQDADVECVGSGTL